MTKENLIAQLEGAKALTSVVSIDNVIALIQGLEQEVKVEKVFKLTPDLAQEIQDKIERVLDYNSRDLVDKDSAEFELSYQNTIELVSVDIDVREFMLHVDAVLEEFTEEQPDSDEDDDELVYVGIKSAEEIEGEATE